MWLTHSTRSCQTELMHPEKRERKKPKKEQEKYINHYGISSLNPKVQKLSQCQNPERVTRYSLEQLVAVAMVTVPRDR